MARRAAKDAASRPGGRRPARPRAPRLSAAEREQIDTVFRALADPTRRRILDLLREQPRTTGELADAFPRLTRYAIMKHLTQLEEASLVIVRREGRVRWNILNAVPIRMIYERWVSAFEGAWSHSLLGLKGLAEGEGAQR